MVIGDLLGVPEADRPLLRPWSAQICGMYEVNPTEEAERVASRAATEFSEYLRELSRERRAHPADDLITALAQVVDGGDQLTEDELIGTVVLLLNAGITGRRRSPASAGGSCSATPASWSGSAATPACCPGRSTSCCASTPPCRCSSAGSSRTSSSPGSRCPRGPSWAAVRRPTRDPAVFPDPDRLDLGRPEAALQLSFGAGVHYCLGAPLGRLELELSFGTLLARLPRMAPAAEPAWEFDLHPPRPGGPACHGLTRRRPASPCSGPSSPSSGCRGPTWRTRPPPRGRRGHCRRPLRRRHQPPARDPVRPLGHPRHRLPEPDGLTLARPRRRRPPGPPGRRCRRRADGAGRDRARPAAARGGGAHGGGGRGRPGRAGRRPRHRPARRHRGGPPPRPRAGVGGPLRRPRRHRRHPLRLPARAWHPDAAPDRVGRGPRRPLPPAGAARLLAARTCWPGWPSGGCAASR